MGMWIKWFSKYTIARFKSKNPWHYRYDEKMDIESGYVLC